jgi:hypothetical protein
MSVRDTLDSPGWEELAISPALHRGNRATRDDLRLDPATYWGLESTAFGYG